MKIATSSPFEDDRQFPDAIVVFDDEPLDYYRIENELFVNFHEAVHHVETQGFSSEEAIAYVKLLQVEYES